MSSGASSRTADRTVPEAFDEEAADEGPVPADRDRSQAAFFLEVVGILASELRQWRLVYRRLGRSNGTLLSQVFEEVTDGRRITAPETSFAPSSLQEAVGDWLMQMGERQVSPPEPPCEVAQQPQALSHSPVGVTQSPEGRDERVHVSGEQVSYWEFGGRVVWKRFLEHVSSPFWVIGSP